MDKKTEENSAEGLIIEKPKKKFGLFKKIILGVIAFFVIVGGFTYFTTKGASEAADKFVSYVQSVDAGSAFELLSTEGKNSGSREQFDTFVSRVGPVLNGEVSKSGVGISAGTGRDTVSTINYRIPGSDGKTYLIKVELVKEDGEWKVLSFDSSAESDSSDSEKSTGS